MTAIEFADDWFGDECSDPRDGHVGLQLRSARIERGLEIEQAGKALNIKPQFLTALEEADTLSLPPRAYAISFARNYAQYLGLDPCAIAEGVKTDCRFRDGYKMDLIEAETPPERRLPKGVAGAICVFALAAVAMTWYGYHAPANSAGEDTPPVPAALAEWSFDEAPEAADNSIWDSLGVGDSATDQTDQTDQGEANQGETAVDGGTAELAAAE